MNTSSTASSDASSAASSNAPLCCELRYRSLFNEGRGYAFPCDDAGHVDMDNLSEIGRSNYFYARAVVGRELALPVVQARPAH